MHDAMQGDGAAEIDRLKRSIDLVAYLEARGVALKQRGQEYDGLCIWHTETRPSMQLFIGEDGIQAVHCKSCGAGGSIVDVAMQLYGCSIGEAITRLRNESQTAPAPNRAPAKAKGKADWLTFPAPDGDVPNMTHFEHGEPVATWRYPNAAGECIGYVARYQKADGDKAYSPFTYGTFSEHTPKKWRPKMWPFGKRPIYGLDLLAQYPAQKIIIGGGEKTADALRILIGGMVGIAYPGGENSWSATDWTPIKGRDVLLIPDADEAGRKSMAELAEYLHGMGCHVRMVDTSDMPDKWDAADALEDGWTSDQFVAWTNGRISEYPPVVEAKADPEPAPPEFEEVPTDAYASEQRDPIFYKNGTASPEFPPDPVDLFTQFTVPELKHGLLPQIIENHVFDEAECINTDPAFGALTALSAIAGLIDDRIKIKIKDGFIESARLWTICCGEPSTKKSPIMDAMTRPLGAIVERIAKADAKIRQQQEIVDARYQAQLKAYTKACIDGANHSLEEPVPPPRLERRRIKVDVLTREAMERVLQDMPSGIYGHFDEISAWLGSFDAYKQAGSNSDRPLWLRAFGGGPMQIDKVGAGSYLIENWSITISGGIQPSKLAALAPKMDDDGLLQRFLIVTSSRQGGQATVRNHNKEYAHAYKELLEHISEIRSTGYPVMLSAGANEAMREAGAEIYSMVNAGMVSRAFTTALGKWEGIIARMILIYHVIDCATDHVHPVVREVTEPVARMAIKYMMEHILPHMVSFYEDGLCQSEAASTAKLIAGQIVSEGLTELSTSRLHKTGPGKWRNGTEQNKVESINRLVEYGWIVPVDGISAATRRPTRFLVNPHVHELFAKFAEQERERIREARRIGAKIRAGIK